jgi:hypothetical protein
MADFILLMHSDTASPPSPDMWTAYFAALRDKGVFDGGSSIGGGEALRNGGVPAALTTQLVGYIRVRAADLAEARALVEGNPVHLCGGTVEVRALPNG